jgi:hypothetical protein
MLAANMTFVTLNAAGKTIFFSDFGTTIKANFYS